MAEVEVEVDRLSDLPLELKTFILDHLTLEEAIRTSALSRSWRYLWTHLASIFFDISLDDDPEFPRDMFHRVEVLDRILSCLRGPICDFDLRYYARSYAALDLFRFLHLILQKGGLRTLWIHNTGCTTLIQLPYFRALKILYLCDFHLLLPNGFQGFDLLEILALHSVCISQEDVQLLINRSRNLTAFRGNVYSDDEQPLCLTFNSPMLMSIQYYFTPSVKEVRIINARHLEYVDISAQIGPTSSPQECAVIDALASKFMADIAIISDFSLDFETLKVSFLEEQSCHYCQNLLD